MFIYLGIKKNKKNKKNIITSDQRNEQAERDVLAFRSILKITGLFLGGQGLLEGLNIVELLGIFISEYFSNKVFIRTWKL